jgi:hypothetical protein
MQYGTPIILVILVAVAAKVALHLIHLSADRKRMRSMVFLQVLMPKKEGKEEKEKSSEEFSSGKTFKDVLGVMDHLFQSVYGIYDSHPIRKRLFGQSSFSVEYAALEGEILFFFVMPRPLVSFFEKQITSFYPDAVIEEVEDYNIFTKESYTSSSYLFPANSCYLPFKTYETLKSDPLNAITNAFSKLESDEGAAVQIVLRPEKSTWSRKAKREAQKLLNPKKRRVSWWNPVSWV